YGLMQGTDTGVFGFGSTITKAEFITVLDRMFGWELISPEVPTLSNVTKDQWYYNYVETALSHGVIDPGKTFAPSAPITREEMAVMLVKGLGYDTLAQSAASLGSPFTDVTNNVGYITIAGDIGMTKGTSDTTFSPAVTAKREEAAAMLVRVYEKYISKLEWVHGFYAISSYSQKELTDDMDAVSLGWSRMSYNAGEGAFLNTASANSNEYNIPEGYENITSYLKENQTKTHLTVYMDTSTMVETSSGSTDICSAILLDSTQRSQAVNAIVNELETNYSTIGYNPYSGVTIDFEGMKGNALKAGFNAFLTELSVKLKTLNKTLYVTVQPATSDGYYYDSYDFRTIGSLADKVILMAHDYNETTMPENLLGSEYYRNTPVTPFASVYYALKAITDQNTGVEDTSKIALAISFSSIGWELENGKLAETSSVRPTPSTIYTRLKGGAAMGYSAVYRNPYITYTTEEGKDIFLWYEDERSVNDKIELAKLFGIKGVSFWRLGTIPNYPDEGIYYDIMDSIH
ncbi:MAG: S-layer homology domain-containing protein, partial [Clostridia bacterium]|nr:S-layer homology domain-containing protein [Clostridia bacterium]